LPLSFSIVAIPISVSKCHVLSELLSSAEDSCVPAACKVEQGFCSEFSDFRPPLLQSIWTAAAYLDCGGPLCVDAAFANGPLLTKSGVNAQRAAAVQIGAAPATFPRDSIVRSPNRLPQSKCVVRIRDRKCPNFMVPTT
jgi:hypothetical protein